MWKIPLFDVDFGREEIQAVERVLRSGWLTMGEVTQKFERRFAEFLGVKHAIAVSSGTAALHLAHLALDIGEGDEVICPSLTFVAGANSIVYAGARPVFADITSAENLNISPDDVERKTTLRLRSRRTNRLKAIQVLHYGGHPCNMKRIREIADKYNLAIVEDCAHAPGAEYEGKKCGTVGDISCFSFFSNKNMTTGEGGMVTTNSDELAGKVRLMRSHGMTSLTLDRHRGHAFSYDVVRLGWNYRIDEMRAAMGIVQLGKLEEANKTRRELVRLYIEKLSDVCGVTIPFKDVRAGSSCHIFAVVLERDVDRQRFMECLKGKGIQTSIHYPPIHKFDLYLRGARQENISLPVTEDVGQREVTLPLYPSMKEENVNYICDTVVECLQQMESR